MALRGPFHAIVPHLNASAGHAEREAWRRMRIKPFLVGLLRLIPLPGLAVLVGLATGLVVWAVLDQVQSRQIDKIFDRELETQVDLRARESLMRFAHHLASYAALNHLLVNAPELVASFESPLPSEGPCPSPAIAQDPPPKWFPELFRRAALRPPSHLVLLDRRGCPFKVFQDESAPDLELPTQAPIGWFEAHLGQGVIERFDPLTCLVLGDAIKDPAGGALGFILMFTPIDAEFLANSQRGLDVGRAAVALVDGSERVLASLDPDTIPLGSRLGDFADGYVISTQPLGGYARPESGLGFATLVSQARLERMSRHVSIFERRQRFYAAAVYMLVFTALFYLVSVRLNKVLKRMTRFAQRALGIPEPGFRRSGNQLILLEEWIQHFTQLVLAAREEMSRRHQAELHEREALKAAMMEASLDAIVTLDQGGRVVEYNPAAEHLFGLARPSALGAVFAERFLPAGSRLAFASLLDRALHPFRDPQGREELIVCNVQGREIPVELSVAAIERGGERFFTLYLHDISERKRAESEIKSLARLASESPTPILRVATDGQIVYANPASRPLLRAWETGPGRPLPADWLEMVGRSLRLGQPLERELESDGQIFSLLFAPIGELGYVNIYGRDITAVRRAEQEARQHQAELVHVCRLSTLGEVATGMAHELNQPLSAIVNYANGCMRRLQGGQVRADELSGAMHQIIQQAQRASEIIKRLRTLVGKQPPARSDADLNQLVREVCSFVEFEIHRLGVRVELDLSPEPILVYADRVQIEQVLLNLFGNALDVLEECPMEGRWLGIRTWTEDGWAMVSMADHGPGIAPERLSEIFAPFVTTKEGGMGMGLAISQTIVENHGGQIWAESQAGAGAIFYVRLPLFARRDESPQPRPETLDARA